MLGNSISDNEHKNIDIWYVLLKLCYQLSLAINRAQFDCLGRVFKTGMQVIPTWGEQILLIGKLRISSFNAIIPKYVICDKIISS